MKHTTSTRTKLPRRLHRPPFTIQRHTGQSLAIVALLLPFLGALLMTAIELTERAIERAMVEDALRQATRSAAQTFDYAAFAADQQHLASEAAPTHTGCDDAPAGSARAVGCAVLLRNLSGAQGLEETPHDVAARVLWTIRPSGGSCTFPGGESVASTAPLVCASVRPRLVGLLGWGSWTPQVDAAETVDTAE
ncbi:MAG: hypothetical protein RLZZ387_1609 [Chloroflexota bacterium]|jgi:hypothetical protein